MAQTILTMDQKMVLDLVGEHSGIAKTFYLSGGTALAEFYLHHRYSDDLDFFTANEDFPQFETEKFAQAIKKAVGANDITYRRLHDRRIFFFAKNKEELKVEFTYYPFSQIAEAQDIDGLKVDSLEDIAANKLMALFDRIEPKDFVDLHFILKKTDISLEKILANVKKKFQFSFEPLTLGSEFAKVRVITKLPKMKEQISLEEVKKFFETLATGLQHKIFEDN